jgi:predicted nucleic acid-binding protein
MPKTRYIYCDSNVFLAYFNREMPLFPIINQLFEEIEKDKSRQIVTSILSITEVAFHVEERKKHRLMPEALSTMDNFWNDRTLLDLIELNEIIARAARDLIRERFTDKLVLKRDDAIHLASAQYIGADEFLTDDDKLYRYSDALKLDIRKPYVLSPKLPFPDEEA